MSHENLSHSKWVANILGGKPAIDCYGLVLQLQSEASLVYK
jgi:hypothetical protein